MNRVFKTSLKNPYKIVFRSFVLDESTEYFFSSYYGALTVFNSLVDSDLDNGLFWSCVLFKGKKILRSYSNFENVRR